MSADPPATSPSDEDPDDDSPRPSSRIAAVAMAAAPLAVRVVRAVLRGRRAWTIVWLLLAIGLLPGLLKLRSDNSAEIFYVQGSSRLAHHQELRRLFPGEHTLRVALRGPGVFQRAGLSYLGHLEQDIGRLEGVATVSGLPTHYQRAGWPPRDPQAFRQQALENNLDRQTGWIAPDGLAATLLVELREQDEAELGATIAAIAALLAEKPAGIETSLLGLPLLNQALDASSREITERYLPILIAWTLLLLLLVLRDLRALLVVLLYVGLGLLATLAPLAYTGTPLNLILAILPPLLFAIGVANAVHLLIAYRYRLAETSPAAATEATFADKAWPMLWSGVTTVLGFLSLVSAPVQPIRELGVWSAWGLLVLTTLSFGLLPLILPWSRKSWTRGAPGRPGGRFELWARGIGRRVATAAFDRPGATMAISAALAALALAGLGRIGVESNALRYLHEDHPLRAAVEALEAEGVGVASIELMIRPPGESAAFRRADQVDALAQVALALDQREDVLGVVDAGTLLRDTARGVVTTSFNAAFQQQLVLDSLAEDAQGRVALARLLSADGQTARMTVFVRTAGAENLEHTLTALEDAARDQFPAAEIHATGQHALLLEAQQTLISTQLISLGSSLLTIGLVLRFLLGSTPLTILALIPNVWPIVGILGAMGFAGIPLDIATVMVASIALGLVVDDTLHTLGMFRQLAPTLGRREAILATLEKTAPAFLLTASILIAGFGVCGFSDFGPIARFGGLAAVAIAMGVVADLVMVPALLALAPERWLERLRA